jgi:probable phosphoglycerate mutase
MNEDTQTTRGVSESGGARTERGDQTRAPASAHSKKEEHAQDMTQPSNGHGRHAALETLGRAFRPLFTGEGGAATELLLVRHAEPDYRAGGNGFAQDPPLTPRGWQQALRLASRLRKTPVQAVYASTMRRAVETAGAVATAKGLPLTCVDSLREIDIDLGALASVAAGSDGAPRELAQRFIDRPTWDALPGMEPSKQFRRRVIEALEAIVAAHPDGRVIVVAHGGVINAYLSMVLDIPRDMFFLPGHASISTVLVHGGLYAVQRLNDAGHLPAAMATL